jgi:hypothetical protein
VSVLTLTAAKDHLNIPTSESDAEIQSFVDSAEAAVTVRVGPLEPVSTTARVAGGGQILLLPVTPAVALTSVTPADGTALSVADLYLDQGAGTVAYTNGSPFFAYWYDVVYDAGRAQCPPDLLLAVKELLRDLWTTQRGKGGQLSTAASQLPPAGTFPGASLQFRPRVEALLAPHISPAGFA